MCWMTWQAVYARPYPADSTMTKAEYLASVEKVKEHIVDGDVFQLVLSHRFERTTFADPFDVYRALRVVGPGRYCPPRHRHAIGTPCLLSYMTSYYALVGVGPGRYCPPPCHRHALRNLVSSAKRHPMTR